MDHFAYATAQNIKRLQYLLETTSDVAARRTIETLLAQERAQAALQAWEPKQQDR
jgi:hypothetical protein